MRTICLFAAIAFLAACNSNIKSKMEATKTSDAESAKQESLTYPYTATYSSDFEIGDAKKAQILLELFKNWDNNTLDNSKSSFAEMDTIFFSDGAVFSGSRDSLFALGKKMRAQKGDLVDSIHAWVPLRSKDKKEDWVLIWTREHSTDSKGKKITRELQETWRFDKDGKINLMYQYEQMPPKMSPPPAKK
ncbi:hypothetical protein [Chitinophaga sp. HK235]|uniref:hypothetical protein n=1 Tax=Chitinophaga sp. HK235 TaxID=2952571 RepID=UPI001BA62512|nr:hypothetical protein [Chitinophaga sp. HK235]